MKSIFKNILVIAVAVSATACFNKKQRNYEYFPDMYQSPSYETYGDYSIFPQGQEAMKPVEGTVSRGWTVYEYPDTFEGKQEAGKNLKNPLPYTERNVEAGKALYDIYCAICHGKKGDGKGPLTTREKILGIPGFDDQNRNITDGDVYHVIYYGLNNMGSYASQTTHLERWQIIHYVMTLKDQLEGRPARPFEKDTTVNSEHFDPEISPVIGRQVLVSQNQK